MDLKNKFGITDATTNHIHGDDIQNYPIMEYSSFTEAHRRIITQLVWEYSCRICGIVCPVNSESLLNNVNGSLSEFPILKQQMDIVQSMVQVSSEIPPYSIQWWALFGLIARYFKIKKLQNLTQDHVIDNE